MPRNRIKVVLQDDERYRIYYSLNLDNKPAELIRKTIENRPGPVKFKTLPFGTVAQVVRWHVIGADDDGSDWTVVKAHQYLLPDGSITGGPDPKYIVIDDVVMVTAPRSGS